jgi:hypothetical protein
MVRKFKSLKKGKFRCELHLSMLARTRLSRTKRSDFLCFQKIPIHGPNVLVWRRHLHHRLDAVSPADRHPPLLAWWFVWTLVRAIRGLSLLNDAKPIPKPRSLMFGGACPMGRAAPADPDG